MPPKYEIGQKVVITPVNNQSLSPRDSGIKPLAGKIGEVIDYYWISPNTGEMFYIYTVRMDTDRKEAVLYEDEIEAYIQ